LVYRQAILDTLRSVNDPDAPEVLLEALQAVLTFAKNRFESLVPLFEVLLMKRDQWAGRIMSMDIEALAAAGAAGVQQTADQLIGEIRGTALADCMSCLEASSGLLAGLEWAANTPALSTDADCLAYLRQFASFMLTPTG